MIACSSANVQDSSVRGLSFTLLWRINLPLLLRSSGFGNSAAAVGDTAAGGVYLITEVIFCRQRPLLLICVQLVFCEHPPGSYRFAFLQREQRL